MPTQRGSKFSGAQPFRWPRLLPWKSIEDACEPESGPLMIRYMLLRTPWFSLYLHHFLRSDHDRHFHDHPWNFLTFILSRGYWENVPAGRFWRRRFSLLWRPATWQHWVEVEPGRTVWTLFFCTAKSREWGFITEKGWIDWVTYGREWCE